MNARNAFYLVVGFVAGMLFTLMASTCNAAEAPLPEWQPITASCYFLARYNKPSAECVGYREEAEDYFAKRHWACASVLYVVWQGSTESVRCRGFDGSVIDYISGTDGNLHTR